jgi:hypothetical protein
MQSRKQLVAACLLAWAQHAVWAQARHTPAVADASLAIEAPSGAFTSLRELRDQKVIQGNRITAPARQTTVYEML